MAFKTTKEVKTASLVISGIILFIWLFNFLKGNDLLVFSRVFYTHYENVEGLVPSASVTINGLSVGKVQEISFEDPYSGRMKVKLIVESDFPFSKNSEAQLYDADLMGSKAIAIIPARDDAEPARDHSTLKGSVKAGLTDLVNQRLTPLQEKVEQAMKSADFTLKNINSIFDEQAKKDLQQSFTQLRQLLDTFSETSQSFNSLIAENKEKLNSTFTNAEHFTNRLSALSDTLAQANITQMLKNIDLTVNTLNRMLSHIEDGKGSAGRLFHEDSLYQNLLKSSKEMEELLRDIKLHPKRYFRILSKKEIPYKKD